MLASSRRALLSTRPSWVTPRAFLDFDFVNNRFFKGSLASLSTVRASSETVTSKAGILSSVGSNVLAQSDAGIIVSPASTNSVLQSGLATGWTPTNSTAAIGATAPDGTANATTLTDNATSGQHSIGSATLSFTSGQAYTWSVFLKAGTLGFAQLNMGATPFSGTPGININLATGAVSTFGTVITASGAIALGNGWWRLFITASATATGSANPFVNMVTSIAAARAPSYVGTGSTIQLWGAQVETGTALTPYIPTTTVAVTRAVDAVSLTIPPGASSIKYLFSDRTTSSGVVSPGTFTLPTNLGKTITRFTVT